MRCIALALLAASTMISCKESEPPAIDPETSNETTPPEPKTLPTPQSAQPSRPVPTVAAEPAAPSPFLVQPAPTAQPTAEAFQADPSQLLPPPHPPPPSSVRPWSTSAKNTGKPCPIGRCLLNGKCVKPGGPIAQEGDPPDVVSGACGSDGGPCHGCRCVSTGTLLSTPNGEMPIEDLRTNDIVWSIHQGHIQAARILATQRVHVQDHSMARIQLQNGFVLEISGEHPTGDGRDLWDLKPGETLGNAQIEALAVVPYAGTFTYDVLPDSDTGTYFVHGMWLGSTMFGQRVRGDLTDDAR